MACPILKRNAPKKCLGCFWRIQPLYPLKPQQTHNPPVQPLSLSALWRLLSSGTVREYHATQPTIPKKCIHMGQSRNLTIYIQYSMAMQERKGGWGGGRVYSESDFHAEPFL